MKVDFYQLSRDPVERVATMLARKVMSIGERLLVVSADSEQRAEISRTLWKAGAEEFLANGEAGSAGADQQPILLSEKAEASNGATMVLLADGKWREDALGFSRVLLLFGPEETQSARELWRMLDGREGVEKEIHKQDESGRWRAGA